MLNAYPRPQLQRDSFFSLNGAWAFAIGSETTPDAFPLTIQVPYPPESKASGIERRIAETDVLWYRKTFVLPDDFQESRVILHFGAVDQHATIYLNGTELGSHDGGYLPFCFDVTALLRAENELTVRATDPLDHTYPWGKQKQQNGGMWYTPFSGVWQTVWLESVPEPYITDLTITPTLTDVTVTVATNKPVERIRIQIGTPDGPLSVETTEPTVTIPIPSPVLWSPERPHLYPMRITAGDDTVSSYFALRTVETKTVCGIPRLLLNGKPYFFHGVLDQGYWQNGICLPDDDGGYETDILAMKRLGFNLLRKHIRVEPLPFYAACDRLGMLVLQDFVNNGEYRYFHDTLLPTFGFLRLSERRFNPESKVQRVFIETARGTIAHLKNAPCIIGWTIFNEGWGQFAVDRVYTELKACDPGRFFDAASGWFQKSRSDVQSEHAYFHKLRARVYPKPLLLSEFGGFVYSLAAGKRYGYRFYRTQEDYQKALRKLYWEQIIQSVEKGLCGAIYTQLSDVEEEQNGLLSADRRTIKADEAAMRSIAAALSEAMERCAATDED